MSGAEIRVDARGLRCPLPVIRLAEAAREAAPGDVIEVWATDPAAAADIPAWCRLRGQEYLGSQGAAAATPAAPGSAAEAGHTAYRVRLAPAG
ncbi:MAG TPA: sulfurtransferase TusA family protein [Pedococcus sp.]|uniref:sulfurtransferase TusA family protein n=1 Tax=Pedococcus sp. TaxID=2860345 RepID=UPI002F95AB9E